MSPLTRLSLSAVLFAGLCAANADAQVVLDRFYPPTVGIGGEAIIAAEGKFPVWPVQIVSDRADVQVQATEESGKLRVVTSADTAPGPVWIRMHDPATASQLVPLLVERGKVVAEVEPNNLLTEATVTDLPAALVGRLEKSGDVDTFGVSVSAGETVVISATAHHILRSPMDAVLQLLDAGGRVLQQSDDQRGLDPQIVYTADQDANLKIRIFAFPETPNSTIGYAGSKEFVYWLRVTTDAFFDHGLPLVGRMDATDAAMACGWNLPPKVGVSRREATDVSPAALFVDGAVGWQWQPPLAPAGLSLLDSSAGEGSQVASELPFVYSGHIDQPGEVDRVRFSVLKGTKYRARVHSRDLGFLLDSVLRLVDADSSAELARNDDSSRNQFDASLDYTAKSDGDVELQVSDLLDGFGTRHAYSVVVQSVSPSVALSLAADRFDVKAGESVEIPVSISRQDGFAKKLSISVDGLPEGIDVEAVVSEPKGDSAKSVKLNLTAAATASYQGPFRVIASVIDDEGNRTDESFVATHPLRDEVRIELVWLSVAAAK